MNKSAKRYMLYILIGGLTYFIVQKYDFKKFKENKLEKYYRKMYGDREKQIQSESAEKFRYDIRN